MMICSPTFVLGGDVIEKFNNSEHPTPEEHLTDKDFDIADEIFNALAEGDTHRAQELYMSADPKVKEMFGHGDPGELLVTLNPEIDAQKVTGFLRAKKGGDEVGMQRIYLSSNESTRKEIDLLNKIET